MESSPPPALTALLDAAREGDPTALDALFARVYDELHRLAHVVRQGRASPTLNTTALVHEAYEKLSPGCKVDWSGRAHFFAVAARAMRQVLVSYARQQNAQKRGGGASLLSLDEEAVLPVQRPEEVMALDEALRRLEALRPRQSQIVEYRFFGGLTIEETAHVMDLSPRTVRRDWQVARLWLSREIKQMRWGGNGR